MIDHEYTDKQIIEALEIRMPHDVICRAAYDLIMQQRADVQELISTFEQYGEKYGMRVKINELKQKYDFRNGETQ